MNHFKSSLQLVSLFVLVAWGCSNSSESAENRKNATTAGSVDETSTQLAGVYHLSGDYPYFEELRENDPLNGSSDAIEQYAHRALEEPELILQPDGGGTIGRNSLLHDITSNNIYLTIAWEKKENMLEVYWVNPEMEQNLDRVRVTGSEKILRRFLVKGDTLTLVDAFTWIKPRLSYSQKSLSSSLDRGLIMDTVWCKTPGGEPTMLEQVKLDRGEYGMDRMEKEEFQKKVVKLVKLNDDLTEKLKAHVVDEYTKHAARIERNSECNPLPADQILAAYKNVCSIEYVASTGSNCPRF